MGVLLGGGEGVRFADLTVGPPSVAFTVETFTSASLERVVVQLLVEPALAAPTVAVAGKTFVRFFRGCSLPVSIPVVVKTRTAVISSSPVLTKALGMWGYGVAIVVCVVFGTHDADVGVTVALTPSTNNDMGDPIVVGSQYLHKGNIRGKVLILGP